MGSLDNSLFAANDFSKITNGCLDIRYLQNYIKDKGYWFDVCHKGATEIFDLKKELLPFIHDPIAFEADKYDAQLRETF